MGHMNEGAALAGDPSEVLTNAATLGSSENAPAHLHRQGHADPLPFSQVQAVWRPERECWEQVGGPAPRIVNRVADMTGRVRPFPEAGI
jgi:hypothetical protein